MKLKPTKMPLTSREFDDQRVGFCSGCGCGCGYIVYLKDKKVVDLWGHPADTRGVGSFCTKGITYIQEVANNPLRLKGVFLKREDGFQPVDYSYAVELLRSKLRKGKTAFLLGRQAGLEEYALIHQEGLEVFTDAPVFEFSPSTLHPTDWKRAKFVLSVDAEPAFSEVMAARWLVDAVESGAYIFCLSSRFETVCAKAKERLILKPDLIVEFLKALMQPERGDEKVEFVRKSLYLLRGSLVLFGSHLLLSPFREVIINLLAGLRAKYGVNYSFVGDLMPFRAKPLEELLKRLEEFDNLLVVGNLLRYFSDEHLELLKQKFVTSFQVFPNITANHSDLLFSSTMFYERDFINYRHGFGYLVYSPKTVDPPEDTFNPYEVLSDVLSTKANLRDFLKSNGVDWEGLASEGEALLMRELPGLSVVDSTVKAKVFLYTDSMLVEDMGHWNPWTHEIERFQKAHVNPKTAKELGIRQTIEIGGKSFEVQLNSNIAEGVVFIPSEYEEFQPFDPGFRIGAFASRPYHRYEVLL